ncbi:MAG: hypothetical protein PWQ96_351 [Clostridia bacterium]|jgi:hypothetical protein|nr:hypothetical protein [Clostridiales bacterium]MDK2984709.1 hypothetical protein [Clostridia bacterium]
MSDKQHVQTCLPIPSACDGFLVHKVCCVPFSCPPVICDERIHLKLSGLTGNLNFQLFRLKGCKVEIELDCPADGKSKVEGIICNVGTNFVDIKLEDNTVITVLIEKIRLIKWTDPQCNPCVPPPPEKPCPPC